MRIEDGNESNCPKRLLFLGENEVIEIFARGTDILKENTIVEFWITLPLWTSA
jgi:hypothetical protein